MARNRALLERDSLVLISNENVDNTPRRATPHSFVATATSTTTVQATGILTGANAYDYVGGYLVPESGGEVDQARQVVSFDPATDTATVRPAWDSNPGTVGFRLWIPTEAVMKQATVPGGGDTFNALATTDAAGITGRVEAADSWSGGASNNGADRWVALGLGGANQDRAALVISDNAASPKVFTLASGSGWVPGAIGDLALLCKMLRVDGGSMPNPDMPHVTIPQRFVKGASALHEGDPLLMGPRVGDATLDIDLMVRPVAAASTQAAGGSVARLPAEADDILRALFSTSSDSATLVDGVATATSIPVDTGTGDERFTTGSLVLIGGTAGQIRNIADGGVGADTLTIATGHLSGLAPPDNALVTGGVNLRAAIDASMRSFFALLWQGGRKRRIVGWQPNVKLEGLIADGYARWKLSGMFDGQHSDGQTFPTLSTNAGGRFPEPPILAPILSRGGRVVLGGVLLEGAISVTLDVGYEMARRDALAGQHAGDGIQVVGRATTGMLKVNMDSFARLREFERGTEMDLLVQIGTERGNTLAFCCPQIQHTGAKMAYESGKATQELPFQVNRSGLTGTDTGATVTIPDFDIALL